jgi:hypothetical protein
MLNVTEPQCWRIDCACSVWIPRLRGDDDDDYFSRSLNVLRNFATLGATTKAQ